MIILTLVFWYSSIYQDVPLHSIEEFQQMAPEEARSDEVLANEHQVMLNRLSFELAERQRCEPCIIYCQYAKISPQTG